MVRRDQAGAPATGIAATMALSADVAPRAVDVAVLQRKLREQGADPGDVPSANALRSATQ